MIARLVCFIPLLAALPACLSSSAFAADAVTRRVFAHYMVCYAVCGESVEGYKREIREAQAAGIDGFALNEGAWTNEPHYVRRTALIFQAAKELGSNFKLFFSLDLATLNPDYAPEIIRAYANNPCYFHYRGRPVVSTFAGETYQGWKEKVLDPLRTEGIHVFFVPFFYPRPDIAELPDEKAVDEHVTKWSDVVDGMFFFGAAGTAGKLAVCNALYTRALHAAGKLSMASFTPFYWGNSQPDRRYYETEGGIGTETQWLSIIKSRPEWVEIVTWNDFNESYICPILASDLKNGDLFHPYRYDHAGYLELSRYFIQWYKTGKRPPIRREALFYYYRPHPLNAKLSDNARLVTAQYGNVKDLLYITVMLKAPAELTVVSGSARTVLPVKAGIQNLSVPFEVGTQRFELSRNGRRILAKKGEPIIGDPGEANFFSITGFAYSGDPGKK